MPRLRRRKGEKFGPLTDREERALTEFSYQVAQELWPESFTPAFESEEDRRRAWEEHGERLTREYREDERNKASRPVGWWSYEVDTEGLETPFGPGYPYLRGEPAKLLALGELSEDELRYVARKRYRALLWEWRFIQRLDRELEGDDAIFEGRLDKACRQLEERFGFDREEEDTTTCRQDRVTSPYHPNRDFVSSDSGEVDLDAINAIL